MDTVSQVKAVMEECFEDSDVEANQQSRAIKRVRKFTPVTPATTFVLGFLNKPQATMADLAGSVALADVDVSPRAIEKISSFTGLNCWTACGRNDTRRGRKS